MGAHDPARGRHVFVPTYLDVDNASRPPFPDVPGAVPAVKSSCVDAYYDGVLGNRGLALAVAVSRLVEHDSLVLREYFGATPHLPTPHVNLVLARMPETERAYHYGGSGTDL